jgi:hypothetical protein
MPRLGLASRRRGALGLAAGLALAGVAALLPVREIHLGGPPMALDTIVQTYQFGEAHERLIRAPREAVWRAVHEVTAREIRLFRTLTWLRSPHTGGAPEGILNPDASRPILDTALSSGFVRLAEHPGHELVFGAVVCCGRPGRRVTAEEFLALDAPGLALAVMNFHLTEEASGVRLRTQTRVRATSPDAAVRFAAYWRVIYPGSALIRRMWLAAIARRAEGGR